jgi:hypothetical protein
VLEFGTCCRERCRFGGAAKATAPDKHSSKQHLEADGSDVLREMVKSFAEV